MDRLKAARVFVDVTQSGSFTATADRLNMSRPMVSRYIEAMEEWLNLRLLHRTTRKVTLTTAGENSLKDIENWLHAGESLADLTRTEEILNGKIRVSTSMSFGFSQLVPATKQFMLSHPDIVVEINVEDNVTDLVENQIDLAIRISSNPDESLIGKPITDCESVLVASPEYLKQHCEIKKPSDLLQHSCLGYKHFEHHVWHLECGNEHESVEITPCLSANEATVLQHAAMHGMGITLQPTYLVSDNMRKGELVHVLPTWKPNDLKIYALYPSRKYQSRAIRAYIDFISGYFSTERW
ncbi:LysR family transcriptional regulator [Vibrio rumoiensis]|uniref:LysR family transcriptional regulator n=1 Tax=Vibrio rumoiensis TaxID=76258 RepID=UPI003AA9E0D9